MSRHSMQDAMKLSARRQLCDNCRTSVKATEQIPLQVRAPDGIFNYQSWEREPTLDTFRCAVVFSWEQVLEAKERCILCSSNFRKATESQLYAHFDRSTCVVAIKYKDEDTNGIHSMRFLVQWDKCGGDRLSYHFDLLWVTVCPLESTSLEENESPNPLWIPALEVSLDTRAASWRKLLQNCMDAHDDCRYDGLFTPTRLLEITGLHDGEYNVRLVCQQDYSVTRPYTTLSYSWGTGANGPTRTTKDNFDEHMRGIAWGKLTKTVQDAIRVTHALGLKLLWVDSLCIIQDDQRDWENEAAKMSDVFAGSELTIAAVDGIDSCDGLKIDSIAPSIFDPPEDGYSGALLRWPKAHFGDLEYSHLYSRGWVFQEILLSRRRLHFAEDHVFWHCRCFVQSEDRSDVSHGEEMLPKEVRSNQDWNSLIFNYSGKDFTSRTDRLAALAGAVKWYSKRFELTPVLGLWRETLSLDLGWQNIGQDCEGAAPRRSTIAGLPSWTWLVWDGYIETPFYKGVEASVPFLQVIDCSINWAGEPMTSPLKSVGLRIRAPLKTLMLTTPKDPYKDGLQLNGWEQSVVILDELGDSSIPHRYTQPKTAHLLILARVRANLQDSESIVTFLVVQDMPKVTEFPRYKRIGAGHIELMDVSVDDLLKLSLLFSDSVDAIVELI